MNPQEWREIAALIENAWKDEFDAAREAAYYKALAPWPAAIVEGAVTALAGATAITDPPVSAAGAYLPSSETIARECKARARIGTYPWVREQLWEWLRMVQSAYQVETGAFIPPDEYFAKWRDVLRASHGELGPRMVALVESFGLSHVLRHGGGNWFEAEARRRWEHDVNGVGAGDAGQLVELPRRRRLQ